MSEFFTRRGATYVNEMHRSLGALLGIATGILADRQLVDSEVQFLNEWLDSNSAIATTWPGDVIHARIKDVLADGRVTDEERRHLVQSLQQLVGGTLDELAASKHTTQLLTYETSALEYQGSSFCLTGDFVFAPRPACEAEIASRGGIIRSSISKKLRYLVVGGLGSSEWKHGSFGAKIEKAMELKREGAKIALVHEDHWAASLRA